MDSQVPSDFDDIYSITMMNGNCYWLKDMHEYDRVKKYLSDGLPLDQNDFMSFITYANTETTVRVGAISDVEVTTFSSRTFRRACMSTYQEEEDAFNRRWNKEHPKFEVDE